MKWPIAALLVLISPWLSLSPASAFDGDGVRLGGPNGTVFHDPCGPGEALVGIVSASGRDLNMVTPYCRAMNGPNADGAKNTLHQWGTPPEGAVRMGDQQICPSPMVVQQLDATMSAVKLIHSYKLRCRNLATGERFNFDISHNAGGKGGNFGWNDCGDGAYATGLWGAASDVINALGLTCATYHAPVANTPQPDKPIKKTGKPRLPVDTTPKPDKPSLKVSNGGGSGASASAASDTTIYDTPNGSEVDYLSAGDPVSIVRCNPNNWCQISQPEAGWVWGDDLNR